MTPERARAIAKTTYLYLYPLVVTYGTMYQEAVDPSSPRYSGGFAKFTHAQRRPAVEGGGALGGETFVLSSAWLDVRAEPWVATVSADGPWRARATRWTDLWGFAVTPTPVGENVDVGHGAVLVVPPGWHPDVPARVDGVVRGDSAFVCCSTITRWSGARDVGQLASGLDAPALTPLSDHVGHPAPPPAPALRWWPWWDGCETTDEFWSCASFALSLTAPRRHDRPLLERLAEIGVVPGRPWDPTALDEEIAEAVDAGQDDALTMLLRAATVRLDPSAVYATRDEIDRDFLTHALGVLQRRAIETGGVAIECTDRNR